MKKFVDGCDRTWELRVDVAAVKRVRSLVGVDLMTALDGKLIQKMSEDPVLLVDVIFACVHPQANAKGINDEKFAEGLFGDALDQATTAFLEELVDFFPGSRRKILAAMLAKRKALESQVVETAMERIEKVQLPSSLGDESGSVPESSASTQASGPSAS